MQAKRDIFYTVLVVMLVCFSVSSVQAGGTHRGGEIQKQASPRLVSPSPDALAEAANERSIKGKLLNVLYVDGFEVKVKIVDAKDSIPDGGTHNILVKIKQGEQIRRNDIVTVKVVFPDHSHKTKTLLELGDWYVGGYDIGQPGPYRIFIAFKRNKKGKEHRIELSYS